MTHDWIQQPSGRNCQPSRSSVKPCKQMGRKIPTHKFTQVPDFIGCLTCPCSIFLSVERRKRGRAKSIKVTVSIIQSVLWWNQPNNTHSFPMAEPAFPLSSLMKWLFKWKEILMGCFILGVFLKRERTKALSTFYTRQFASEALWSHFRSGVIVLMCVRAIDSCITSRTHA